MPADAAEIAASSLGKLKISSKQKANPSKVADSWEDGDAANDDDDDESSDTETEGASTPIRPSTANLPGAPPPTPSSPVSAERRDWSYQLSQPFDYGASGGSGSSGGLRPSAAAATGEERRPDKTTSVASRLIAAGIGQKAPKRTPEQREYDQAMKVQEKKRRDQAKAEEERKKLEKEKAQKDIWGD